MRDVGTWIAHLCRGKKRIAVLPLHSDRFLKTENKQEQGCYKTKGGKGTVKEELKTRMRDDDE